jgi:hypothetical protein
MSCPAHAGHPVRRGFSFIADFPAYWIIRFAAFAKASAGPVLTPAKPWRRRVAGDDNRMRDALDLNFKQQ